MRTQHVIAAAEEFANDLERVDRNLRRAGTTVPSAEIKDQVASRFWSFVSLIDQYRNVHDGSREMEAAQQACREIVGNWLFRCRWFSRAFLKPHGYAGDFRMVEWMYDAENDTCADATQPGIVNCLDHVFRTVHSVQSVWERRHRFSQFLRSEHEARGGRLRMLDVACGGARYVADFLKSAKEGRVEITLVDQDVAAIAYCKSVSLRNWRSHLTAYCLPIKRLTETLTAGEYDVVLSAGLYDYLPDGPARALTAYLMSLLAPDGVLGIANYHPGDPSRTVKDWLVDWPLIFRTEEELAALFPEDSDVQTSLSANGSLAYAFACNSVRPTRRAYPPLRFGNRQRSDGA